MKVPEIELAEWRRQVHELYAEVRSVAEVDPAEAHGSWRQGRDRLFAAHPQSPLPEGDPMRAGGVPYFQYDPVWRWSLPLQPGGAGEIMHADSGADGVTSARCIGTVELPDPVGATLAVWWLEQYGGGLWLPLRDATAGRSTYGGGRYVLDTAKGADLGTAQAPSPGAARPAPARPAAAVVVGDETLLVIDFNFAYHPSCRYSPRWTCPLAPVGNRVAAAVEAGERLIA